LAATLFVVIAIVMTIFVMVFAFFAWMVFLGTFAIRHLLEHHSHLCHLLTHLLHLILHFAKGPLQPQHFTVNVLIVADLGCFRGPLPVVFFAAFAVAFSAVLTALTFVFTVSFTMTMFAVSDFRMSRPAIEVLACCRQFDFSFLAGFEIGRRCRAEFSTIGQVHFDTYFFQSFVRGVFYRALKGIAFCIIRQNQPGTVSNLVIGFVQGELSARFFAFLAVMTVTISIMFASAFAIMLTTASVVFTRALSTVLTSISVVFALASSIVSAAIVFALAPTWSWAVSAFAFARLGMAGTAAYNDRQQDSNRRESAANVIHRFLPFRLWKPAPTAGQYGSSVFVPRLLYCLASRQTLLVGLIRVSLSFDHAESENIESDDMPQAITNDSDRIRR